MNNIVEFPSQEDRTWSVGESIKRIREDRFEYTIYVLHGEELTKAPVSQILTLDQVLENVGPRMGATRENLSALPLGECFGPGSPGSPWVEKDSEK